MTAVQATAHALQLLDRDDEAMELLTEAVRHLQNAPVMAHLAMLQTELGRHEEALAIWDEMLKVAAELAHNPSGVLNYSALAYRELYDLDEARRRTEQVIELTAGMKFGMPKQFAGSDLIQTHLLGGDIGAAETEWPRRRRPSCDWRMRWPTKMSPPVE